MEAATDRARALHIEGARLFEAGKYDQAYVAFVAAWALKKHPQIAANLADCEMKLGKYRDAAEHFAFVVRDPSNEAKPDLKRTAQQRLTEAQAKVGTLTLSGSPTGAEVLLDGKAVGTAPLDGPIFVEPGHHTIEALRAGAAGARATVDVGAGEARDVVLAEETAQPPPTPPPVVEQRPLWPVIAAGGAAVVALGSRRPALTAQRRTGRRPTRRPPDGAAPRASASGPPRSAARLHDAASRSQVTLSNAAPPRS